MRTVLLICLLITANAFAQEDVGYKTPPKEIESLVMAMPTPGVSIDSKGEWLLLMERASFPPVEELAQPELRLAGIRINPNNFGPSRSSYVNGIKLKNIKSGKEFSIEGLPANLKASSIQWSPSESSIAFAHSTNDKIFIYVIDLATQRATQVVSEAVNAVTGAPFQWAGNDELIYKAATQPASAIPVRPPAPTGPVIQESKGSSAASRTYQDLIKSSYDEQVFEFYATSQLKRVSINGSQPVNLGEPGLFTTVNVSPDKRFLLVRMLEKPFSYLFPWYGFPHSFNVLDSRTGRMVRSIAKNPSSEGQPIGFDDVAVFPRNVDWRDDEPSTIVFTKALDKGLGRTKSEFRDALMAVSAEGNEEPRELFRTRRRFDNVIWGNAETALVFERMFADRKMRMSKYNSSTGKLDSLFERSTNDSYSDIGRPFTVKNKFDKQVLLITRANQLLLRSSGSSDEGDMPLVQTFDLQNGKTNIVWRSKAPYYEYVVDVLDAEKKIFITSRESPTEVPNYHILSIAAGKGKNAESRKPITNFENPYPMLEGITRQKISYKRADSISLTGNLYLPKGFQPGKDSSLPVLIWAYPREYKSAADAAQVRGSKYTFTRINYGSPIFWVTQGYAVLDNAEMPIVGEGKSEPNDKFIPQLHLNAHAAIQALAKMGVGDSTRVAVGGHSYGAFMTANLLAHTKLFRAGIARSGAYNRTLTPFGFQAEERTYWQAPEVYFNMSPFSFAHQIKTPLLLIHGDADNNPGTFPIQSERLMNAVKGHGGIVRFVSLPYESHGYAAKENILHMLWEQNQWLETYVKPKGNPAAGQTESRRSF